MLLVSDTSRKQWAILRQQDKGERKAQAESIMQVGATREDKGYGREVTFWAFSPWLWITRAYDLPVPVLSFRAGLIFLRPFSLE